jgi:hypothetical protein
VRGRKSKNAQAFANDSILLTGNIAARNHSIVERIFEAETIDFKIIVVSKSALYVKNLIVDQSIIQKRSERTRKSDFLIVISNTKLVQDLIVD